NYSRTSYTNPTSANKLALTCTKLVNSITNSCSTTTFVNKWLTDTSGVLSPCSSLPSTAVSPSSLSGVSFKNGTAPPISSPPGTLILLPSTSALVTPAVNDGGVGVVPDTSSPRNGD